MKDAIYTVTIEGIRPLLMHSGRLADPLDPHTKKLKTLSKVRNKSDDDHIAVARCEFEGGAYHDPQVGLYLPSDVLQAAIVEGARKRKLGKTFEPAVFVEEPAVGPAGFALEYKGPKDLEGLWSNSAFRLTAGVRVSQSRVMRTRLRVPTGWRCTFSVEVMSGAVTKEQLRQALVDAGAQVGVGDWRPRYGRFVVKELS